MSGWQKDSINFDDDLSDIEPSKDNLGFLTRSSWFRKSYKPYPNPYRSSGYTFLGPFKHELHGVTKPIIPGTKILFQLIRSNNKFSLLRVTKPADNVTDDTEEYRAIIISCMLYVKVAHMTLPLWREIKQRFQKEPIKYFYRRLQIKVIKTNVFLMYSYKPTFKY